MSDGFQVNKIGFSVPVSSELLRQAQEVGEAMQIAMGLKPDPRTPEQIAADRAVWEEQRRQERADIDAKHSAALANAEGLARAVLVLHAPVFDSEWSRYAVCQGCDIDGYEAEWPAFPCRTYGLARGWVAGE